MDRARGILAVVVLPGIESTLQAPVATSLTPLWLFLLGLYLVFLLIALWVYQDARIRGMNRFFWLAAVLLAPIVGLIGYIIFRRERPT